MIFSLREVHVDFLACFQMITVHDGIFIAIIVQFGGVNMFILLDGQKGNCILFTQHVKNILHVNCCCLCLLAELDG